LAYVPVQQSVFLKLQSYIFAQNMVRTERGQNSQDGGVNENLQKGPEKGGKGKTRTPWKS